MASKSQSTTILVPTFNRPNELARLLFFLQDTKNPYPVLVLDGSQPDIQSKNERLARQYEFVQWTGYRSDLHQGLRYADGLSQVKTEYVVICPDDDFIFPEAVEECARFLDSNSDYSSAVGRVRAFLYPKSWRFLRYGFMLLNPLAHDFNLSHKHFIQRLLYLVAFTYAGCPPLFYAVRRTAQARTAFLAVSPDMKYSSQELLTNAITLLLGKATVLPIPYGLRDYSSEPIVEQRRDDPVNYFTESDLKYIRATLVPMMMNQEHFSRERADYLADMFLEDYYPSDNRFPPLPEALSMSFGARITRLCQTLCSMLFPGFLATATGIHPKTLISIKRAHRQFLNAPLL